MNEKTSFIEDIHNKLNKLSKDLIKTLDKEDESEILKNNKLNRLNDLNVLNELNQINKLREVNNISKSDKKEESKKKESKELKKINPITFSPKINTFNEEKELQSWLDSERPVFFINNRGNITKNSVHPITNKIYTEGELPFNQPDNFNKFLDNYFKYRLN